MASFNMRFSQSTWCKNFY